MTPRTTLLASLVAALLAAPLATSAAVAPHPGTSARPHAVPMSASARRVVQWARNGGDAHGRPFAIIDKPNARLFVFDARGQLRGSAPVLLGSAKGDDTAPGIGDLPLEQIRPELRTTPAGRFEGEHGTNGHGVHVIWIDYDAAVSMHPVINPPGQHRLLRLATPTIADNRISFGCVNVPSTFFKNVVLKTLTVSNPVIYVLPDVKPLDTVFAGLGSAPASGARSLALRAGTAPARKPDR
jgi:hypothetical protein